MSRTWSLVVVDTVVPSIILGLLILLAAHFCASTVLNDLAWLLVLNPRASLLNLLKRRRRRGRRRRREHRFS
uniref:Uncharacterized protein n=1 Tax=Populus trichocarpa TaxID=3694 RepID=A0A2K2B2K5_POPTR